MIDGLLARAAADAGHQAGNPRAAIRLPKGNAAAPKQVQHELEMPEILDGNAIEIVHAVK